MAGLAGWSNWFGMSGHAFPKNKKNILLIIIIIIIIIIFILSKIEVCSDFAVVCFVIFPAVGQMLGLGYSPALIP